MPSSATRPDRAEDRGDAALHVAGAAPVQPAVADLAAPRVDRPGGRSPGGTTSTWPDSTSRRPPRSPDPADDDRQRRARHLLARPVRVVADGRRVRVEHLDGQPERLEPVGSRAAIASSSPVTLGIRTSVLEVGDAGSPVDGVGRRARRRSQRPARSRRAGSAGSGRSRRPSRSRPTSPSGTRGPRSRPPRARAACRRCPRPRSRPRAGPRGRCSRASGTPPRAPRPAGCRARPSSAYRPAGSSGRNTTATSSATGEITDSRWTSSAGPFQYGTSNTRTSPPTIAASWRAPSSLVRSVRPMHRRSGRSQNVSPPSIVPGASIRPSVGMPARERPALEDARARRARFGLPGRSGIAPPSATSSGSNT